MRKRNSNAGLLVFWVKLRQRGYTRSVTGLYRLCAYKGKWLLSYRTLSILQGLMNKCSIPVKEYK